jgi:hypothetical protein
MNTMVQKVSKKCSGVVAPPANHHTSAVVFIGEDEERLQSISL